MLIKGIEHVAFYDVEATIVVAPTSSYKYKEQWRKNLKKKDDIIMSTDEIIEKIKEEGNELIILGGLEWCENMADLVELLSNIPKEFRCIIETGDTVENLLSNVGAHSLQFGIYPEELGTPEDDYELRTFLGEATLDYLLGNYIIIQVKHKGNSEEKLYYFDKGVAADGNLH